MITVANLDLIALKIDEIERALAQDLLFADQLDEALKLYQKLVEDDPKDVQSQLRISQIYRQIEGRSGSKTSFQRFEIGVDVAKKKYAHETPDRLPIIDPASAR